MRDEIGPLVEALAQRLLAGDLVAAADFGQRIESVAGRGLAALSPPQLAQARRALSRAQALLAAAARGASAGLARRQELLGRRESFSTYDRRGQSALLATSAQPRKRV